MPNVSAVCMHIVKVWFLLSRFMSPCYVRWPRTRIKLSAQNTTWISAYWTQLPGLITCGIFCAWLVTLPAAMRLIWARNLQW